MRTRCRSSILRLAESGRGVLLVGFVAWTIACAIWFGPTAYEWYENYRSVMAWRATGDPSVLICAPSFVDDLPYKVGFAAVIPVFGYAIVLALAGMVAIARRHADRILGVPAPLRRAPAR